MIPSSKTESRSVFYVLQEVTALVVVAEVTAVEVVMEEAAEAMVVANSHTFHGKLL